MPDSQPISRHERGCKREYQPPTMRKISREEAMRLLRDAASSEKSNPSKADEDFRRRVESVLSNQ